jgi:hypothetical protein
MAAQAARSLNPLACIQAKIPMALYGCLGLLAVVIGVQGLSGASLPGQTLGPRISLHALFALLLCGLVLAQYRGQVRRSPRMSPADARKLSCRLSRIVYLLLYIVIGLRQLIGIATARWHGGAVDFNLFDARFHNGPDYAGFDPRDDFQLFVASGLVALIFVRALTFRLWLCSVEHAALSDADPARSPLGR